MQEGPLSAKAEEQIRQVAATMTIENMPLTEQCYKNLYDLASGAKSIDGVIADMDRRYAHD